MTASTAAQAETCYVRDCKYCSFDDDPWYCGKCMDGYYRKDGRCIKGSMEYCIVYALSEDGDGNPDKCSVCEKETYLDENGKCVKGKYHCEIYRENGSGCKVCAKGYAFGNDGKCYPNNVERCYRVRPGEESNPNKCFICEDGYGTKDGKECVPCEDEHAKTCQLAYDWASECSYGYILYTYYRYSQSKTICVKFPGCKKTDPGSEKDKPLCAECEHWATLSDDRTQCLSCPNGCAACSDTTTCTRCYDGYELKNGACEKKPVCPENADCSDGNVTCNSGYELKNGACVKPACPANCTACSSSTACTACDSGYSLIGGKCVAGTVAKCPPDSSISPDGCCCVPN